MDGGKLRGQHDELGGLKMADVHGLDLVARLGQRAYPAPDLGNGIGARRPVDGQVQGERLDGPATVGYLPQSGQVRLGDALAHQRGAAVDDQPVAGQLGGRLDRGRGVQHPLVFS